MDFDEGSCKIEFICIKCFSTLVRVNIDKIKKQIYQLIYTALPVIRVEFILILQRKDFVTLKVVVTSQQKMLILRTLNGEDYVNFQGFTKQV